MLVEMLHARNVHVSLLVVINLFLPVYDSTQQLHSFASRHVERVISGIAVPFTSLLWVLNNIIVGIAQISHAKGVGMTMRELLNVVWA